MNPIYRAIIMDRDGNKCLCCGSTEKLTIDHIVPKSKGGGNELSNYQTLCGKCNNKKGTSRTDYRNEKAFICCSICSSDYNVFAVAGSRYCESCLTRMPAIKKLAFQKYQF